jgi:hypothetical protein
MKSKLPADITPGEILDEEFLKPIAVTQYRLAKDIGGCRRAASTKSSTAGARSRRTPPCDWDVTSACRRSSGSTCNRTTNWNSNRNGSVLGSTKRSRPWRRLNEPHLKPGIRLFAPGNHDRAVKFARQLERHELVPTRKHAPLSRLH